MLTRYASYLIWPSKYMLADEIKSLGRVGGGSLSTAGLTSDGNFLLCRSSMIELIG